MRLPTSAPPLLAAVLSVAALAPASLLAARGESVSMERLLAEGRWAEAEARVQATIRTDGWKTAERWLRRLVRERPDRPDYRALLGFCQLKRHDHTQAEANLRLALELAPSQTAWRVALARSLHLQGRYRAALAQLERAVDEDPRPEYRYALASAAWNARRFDRVEEEIRLLLAERPDDPGAACWLGKLLFEIDRSAEASEALKTCLEGSPENLESRFHLGILALRAGRDEEALDAFQEVLDRDPGHMGALYNLGRAFLRVGRREEAEPILAYFERHSRLEDQIEALRNDIRMGPRNPAPRRKLVRLLLDLDRGEDALEAAHELRALTPEDPEALRLLARALEDQGLEGRARAMRSEAERLGETKR